MFEVTFLNTLSNLWVSVALLYSCTTFAMDVPIEDFSLEPYPQSVAQHVYTSDNEDTKPVIKPEIQTKQLAEFYRHNYSTAEDSLSPWGESLIKALLPLASHIEQRTLDEYNNEGLSSQQQHYGENFKLHDLKWWTALQNKMQLSSLEQQHYTKANRAIAISNTLARNLPDQAPDFFHASLPGQGFPFDNIQDASIWVGTPLYVLSTTTDNAWSLVLTPEAYITWVKSQDIAFVSDEFIQTWQRAAHEGLIAITHTEASILDQDEHFQFSGYIGAVFPYSSSHSDKTHILIPIKKAKNQADIHIATVATSAAARMPLLATRTNIGQLIQELQNRPYGWGGAYFFNDCSQELKNLFTPLGIWLPKNSAKQSHAGPSIDLSNASVHERLTTLTAKGHPLATLIYIKGHIMLYTGNEQGVAMTYQNIWGLSPESHDKRYVIGQSLFLPLLEQYPEHPDIISLAAHKAFKIVFLDEMNPVIQTPEQFAKQFMPDLVS